MSPGRRLTCDAAAELDALLLRVESVLVALAATVVERCAFQPVRVVVELGVGLPAGARIGRLCAAHCNRWSESMLMYFTELQSRKLKTVQLSRLQSKNTFVLIHWNLQQPFEVFIHWQQRTQSTRECGSLLQVNLKSRQTLTVVTRLFVRAVAALGGGVAL